MQCRMTASLRATATLAFFGPTRLASLVAQLFSDDGAADDGEEHVGGLEDVVACEPIASFGDAAISVEFA